MYMGRKYTVENGVGYYVCTTTDESGKRRRLHDVMFLKEGNFDGLDRADVMKDVVGVESVEGADEIPAGYVVHHIDMDKTHNEINNLTLMTVEAHNLVHNPPKGDSEKKRDVVIVPGGVSYIKSQ